MNERTSGPGSEPQPSLGRPLRIARGVTRLALTSLLVAGAWKMQSLYSEQVERIEKQNQEIDRIADMLAYLNDVNAGVITGESLKDIEEFRSSQVVSPENRELLKTSTVKLGRRLKSEPTAEWQASCTATKVTDGSSQYIMSATHCFYKAPSKGAVQIHPYENITNVTEFDYAVLSGPNDSPEVIADISSIAISGVADIALMKVGSYTSNEFTDKTSIPFSSLTATYMDAPEIGSEVAIYSYPGIAIGEPVINSGKYLGRVADPRISIDGGALDIVVIHPESTSTDGCYYGASGSSAMFANGYLSGPLSIRNDRDFWDSRLRIESNLEVELNDDDVICGYATMYSSDMMQSLQQSIETGESFGWK